MICVDIKPLSVNQAWKGRRYKTKAYKVYEQELIYKLPPKKINHNKNITYSLFLTIGLSSKNADLSNPLKLIEDIITKKYKINDKNYKSINLTRDDVKKGKEYVKIEIVDSDNNIIL